MANPWLLGGAAASGIVGSLLGADAQKDAAQAQADAIKEAMARLAAVDLPSIAEQELELKRLEEIGELTPEMMQAIELGPSAMEDVSIDPRLASAQMSALEKMAQLAEGGVTEADLAALDLIGRDSDAAFKSKSESILQEMQQRGQGGSGSELAAKLQAAQQSADAQNVRSLDVLQKLMDREMGATAQQANIASQTRSQDFGEQARIAAARDAIKEFNARNKQRVADTNVAARNQAQAENLAYQRELQARNAEIANRQQQYNKGLIQQDYANRIARAGGQADLTKQLGQAQAGAAQGRAGMYAGIGSAVGSGLAGIYGAMAADEDRQIERDKINKG